MTKYKTIRIPVEVMSLIDELIKKKELGFQSKASVVKAGIREIFGKYIGYQKEKAESK